MTDLARVVPPWWQRHLLDVLAAFGAVAVIGSANQLHAHGGGERGIDAVAISVGLVGMAAVLARRISPLASLVVPCVAVGVYLLRNYPNGPTYFLLPLGVFCFGFYGERRLALRLGPLAVLAVALCAWLGGGPNLITRVTIVVSWGIAALVLAEWLRTVADRALERRKVVQQQQMRAQVQQQLELARDLHDSVAHALTAITVQAALAERLAYDEPRQAAEAARAARIASRDALAELGAIVGSLREPGTAPTRPQPDLREIDELVERAREAGLHVNVDRGQLQGIPAPVQAAAYRVVQEGLTNAVRYAPGGRLRLVLRSDGTELRVELTDDGPAIGSIAQPPGGGHGLVGMTERVRATGGVLRHGPRPEGGYAIQAHWTTA
ncbi:sensor histidine kinase [Flexivirga caeni]|nr:histidine kinase [Flexivirga caeni]